MELLAASELSEPVAVAQTLALALGSVPASRAVVGAESTFLRYDGGSDSGGGYSDNDLGGMSNGGGFQDNRSYT